MEVALELGHERDELGAVAGVDAFSGEQDEEDRDDEVGDALEERYLALLRLLLEEALGDAVAEGIVAVQTFLLDQCDPKGFRLATFQPGKSYTAALFGISA